MSGPKPGIGNWTNHYTNLPKFYLPSLDEKNTQYSISLGVNKTGQSLNTTGMSWHNGLQALPDGVGAETLSATAYRYSSTTSKINPFASVEINHNLLKGTFSLSAQGKATVNLLPSSRVNDMDNPSIKSYNTELKAELNNYPLNMRWANEHKMSDFVDNYREDHFSNNRQKLLPNLNAYAGLQATLRLPTQAGDFLAYSRAGVMTNDLTQFGTAGSIGIGLTNGSTTFTAELSGSFSHGRQTIPNNVVNRTLTEATNSFDKNAGDTVIGILNANKGKTYARDLTTDAVFSEALKGLNGVNLKKENNFALTLQGEHQLGDNSKLFVKATIPLTAFGSSELQTASRPFDPHNGAFNTRSADYNAGSIKSSAVEVGVQFTGLLSSTRCPGDGIPILNKLLGK